MLLEIIEKEMTAVRKAVHAVRERIHPTTVMKRQEFVRSLDDLGQPTEDLERYTHERYPPTPAP